MTRWAVGLLVAGVVAGGMAGRASAPHERETRVVREVRPCPEDTVLMGFGEFKAGRWAAYRCIAADDVGTEWDRRRANHGRWSPP